MRRGVTSIAAALALAGAAFTAALTLPGAEADAGEPPASETLGSQAARGNFTLAQARSFRSFPLLYAGASFRGLPLTAVLRRNDRPYPGEPIQPNTVAFVYGDCEAAGDMGCAPPLEVKVWPACRRNPSVYDLPGGADERLSVRHVPARFYDGSTRLELSTGRVTVVLYGSSREQLLDAAHALRGANFAHPVDEALPQPARGATAGRLACRAGE